MHTVRRTNDDENSIRFLRQSRPTLEVWQSLSKTCKMPQYCCIMLSSNALYLLASSFCARFEIMEVYFSPGTNEVEKKPPFLDPRLR